MIHVKDHKQHEMFDPWDFLSPKRRRMLDQGWPGLFRKQLLCELPVNQIKPFLREDFGRPSKELYTLLGVLLLQQAMDLNDSDTIEQLSFNIQWHYALNITEESDSAKYISEKTLWSWRMVLLQHNLDQLIFEKLTDKLARVFKVNTDDQRLDSVHIRSNMRKLGRISLFSQTIHKFLVNLKRHYRHLFNELETALIERYWSKKALAAFSLVKPSASAKTLETVSSDLFDLIQLFKDESSVCGMHSYKLMQRVLNEQCQVNVDEKGSRVSVKDTRQIPSGSMQNPSDPDATYSGHKGQGYQAQIMETFTRTEDPKKKAQELNLITHVAVETACKHDVHALEPAIEDTKARGLAPKTLVADTLYGTDDNEQKATKHGVQMVAPVHKGGQRSKTELKAFEFEDSGHVKACPAGHRPVAVRFKKKTQRYSARFDLRHCKDCPQVGNCRVKAGKNYYFMGYSAQDQRLAVRQQMETSDAFIETYRWRAGIEATMSQYNALTGVKHLRVRGMMAVRYCATLKAIGLNILRAVAVRKARNSSQGGAMSGLLPKLTPFPFVKEQIYVFLQKCSRFMYVQPI
jgi:hypothetical protein